MEFDIKKIEKLSLSNTKNTNIDLTLEERKFLSDIFNTIINSEDYDATTKYLAAIHGMSISQIKFIRNVYYFYIASNEEKMIYNKKIRELKQKNRKKGFIDLSAMISFTIFISVVGITLAFVLYNLL